jgi:hypothetical protein
MLVFGNGDVEFENTHEGQHAICVLVEVVEVNAVE